MLRLVDVLQNRYCIIKLLGEGGFGAVCLAEDNRLQGRKLALKVYFDNSPEAEKQFQSAVSTPAIPKRSGFPDVTDYCTEVVGRCWWTLASASDPAGRQPRLPRHSRPVFSVGAICGHNRCPLGRVCVGCDALLSGNSRDPTGCPSGEAVRRLVATAAALQS